MIEPLEVVYVSTAKPTSSYHRAPSEREVRAGHIDTLTKCGRLTIDQTHQRPEMLAVLTRDPCRVCFYGTANYRRRLIQQQMAAVPEEHPVA